MKNEFSNSIYDQFDEACGDDSISLISNPLETNFIDSFIEDLFIFTKMRIVKYDSGKNLPIFLLLNTDKGIIGYLDFENKSIRGSEEISYSKEKIINIIRKGFSTLDRPVFLINFCIYNGKVKIIFFTDEEIKDAIFSDKINLSDENLSFPQSMSGDLNDLLRIFNSLKTAF